LICQLYFALVFLLYGTWAGLSIFSKASWHTLDQTLSATGKVFIFFISNVIVEGLSSQNQGSINHAVT